MTKRHLKLPIHQNIIHTQSGDQQTNEQINSASNDDDKIKDTNKVDLTFFIIQFEIFTIDQ